MPINKEVFFRNKKKCISFLSEEEMLHKITTYLISEDDRKDSEKKEKAILKNLNWFQKINFANKEFFVEKSNNPLKIKDSLIDYEKSDDSFFMILGLALIPFCLFPVSMYLKFNNWKNKRKVQKGESVYLNNNDLYIPIYAVGCMLANIIMITSLLFIKSLNTYLALFLINLISGLSMSKAAETYIDIENYDLMEFTLEEQNFEDSNAITNKIRNMQSKEINIKDKKIEYDFIKEMNFSKNESSSEKLEQNVVSFEKHL